MTLFPGFFLQLVIFCRFFVFAFVLSWSLSFKSYVLVFFLHSFCFYHLWPCLFAVYWLFTCHLQRMETKQDPFLSKRNDRNFRVIFVACRSSLLLLTGWFRVRYSIPILRIRYSFLHVYKSQSSPEPVFVNFYEPEPPFMHVTDWCWFLIRCMIEL